MSSILVTGTDLVGKSTLVEGLENRLLAYGYDVIANKDDLYKTQLYPFARQLMDKDWEENKLVINSLLAMSFLVDGLEYEVPEGKTLIQDSYVYRTIALCHAYGVPHIPKLLENFSSDLYHFDVNILLKADIAEKQKRLRARPKRDIFDDDILKNPDIVIAMDYHLEELVKNEKNYLQIDTTKADYASTLEQAWDYVKVLV